MIRTFEFLPHFQNDRKDRQKVLAILNSNENADLDYRGWHFHFDAEKRWVQITDNGTEASLFAKFAPVEVSYKTMTSGINKEFNGDLEIRYL